MENSFFHDGDIYADDAVRIWQTAIFTVTPLRDVGKKKRRSSQERRRWVLMRFWDFGYLSSSKSNRAVSSRKILSGVSGSAAGPISKMLNWGKGSVFVAFNVCRCT